MPNKDGTGPRGTGPMTGQGKGRCVISLNKPKEELEFLKDQEQSLKKYLRDVKSRIRNLENQTN